MDGPLTLQDAIGCDDVHKWKDAMHDEYKSLMRLSTKEAILLRQLMADVRCILDGATNIMCDNQGSMLSAKNPTHHSRAQHIDVQYNFI